MSKNAKCCKYKFDVTFVLVLVRSEVRDLTIDKYPCWNNFPKWLNVYFMSFEIDPKPAIKAKKHICFMSEVCVFMNDIIFQIVLLDIFISFFSYF